MSLNVKNGKLGQVQVTLHLKSGTVFYEKTDFSRAERRAIDNDVEDMIVAANEDPDNDDVFDRFYAEYKKQNPEKFREETEIADWSISFLTDLDNKPYDLNLLQQVDPAAHEAASKCLVDQSTREATKI